MGIVIDNDRLLFLFCSYLLYKNYTGKLQLRAGGPTGGQECIRVVYNFGTFWVFIHPLKCHFAASKLFASCVTDMKPTLQNRNEINYERR